MAGFRPTKEQIKHIKRCKDQKKQNDGKPVQMPWILVTVCEGCGDCVEACVGKGIKLVNEDKKVPNVWLLRPEGCIGCGFCAAYCQWGAIQMTTHVDWALEKYEKSKEGPFPSRYAEEESSEEKSGDEE
jgi:ferredoxin